MRGHSKKRAELAWTVTGFVIAQIALGICVDQFWRPIRDPEFAYLLRQVTARLAESPGRPLVLALGSSRTRMGLQAARLSQSSGDLVFNFGLPGSGPMMQQLALRRLLDAGVRPNFLFLETIPVSLSRREGAPMEERQLDPARLNRDEATRIQGYYGQPYKLWGRWLVARLLPTLRHQTELRQVLALDVEAAGPTGNGGPVDNYGWQAWEPVPPNLVERKTHATFNQYGKALRDGNLGKGPADALRDLLEMCRREGIPAAVIVPPESSVFRAAYVVPDSPLDTCVRQLTDQRGVRLFDARWWVEDPGFLDGHHLSRIGADQYTRRFRREALAPFLGTAR